jgi:hypothetical protein
VLDSARRGFADGLCRPLRGLCPPGELSECVAVSVLDLPMVCAVRCVHCIQRRSGHTLRASGIQSGRDSLNYIRSETVTTLDLLFDLGL